MKSIRHNLPDIAFALLSFAIAVAISPWPLATGLALLALGSFWLAPDVWRIARIPAAAALLCLALAPSFALAQAEPAPAAPPSVLGEFAKQFLTPQGIASVVLTVLGLIAGVAGLSAQRKRQIAIVTEHAFHGVEDFAATTETTVDDKVAAGLKIADEWMRAQGWRPLKPNETEVVKLGFSALNGQTKVAEKVAEAQAVPPKP